MFSESDMFDGEGRAMRVRRFWAAGIAVSAFVGVLLVFMRGCDAIAFYL
jgi:hypothetical protein